MTMEADVVNEFLARKAFERKDRQMRFAANLIMYTGIALAVLSIVDLMLRAG